MARRKPSKTIRRQPRQMLLNVRIYRVEIADFGSVEVQAPGRSAARWRAFQLGREVGYFGAGFRDFIARRPAVAELKLDVMRDKDVDFLRAREG